MKLQAPNQSQVQNALTVFFGMLILCSLAFINEFPLVYTDTGTYIHSGFRGDVPIDRTIYYGLFIKHTTYGYSPWLAIFAQSLLLSGLLFNSFQLIYREKYSRIVYLVIVGLITATTGISFNASILIPDVFSSICLLSSFIILYDKDLSKLKKNLLFVTVAFSLSVHLSHLPILLISLVLLFIIQVFSKNKIGIQPKRIRSLFLTVLITILTIPCTNYLLDRTFQLSGGGHVFMLNHLLEIDVLQDYLRENCTEKNYALCEHVEELNNYEFMWDLQSPLYTAGGWQATKNEYNEINKAILLNPKYYPKIITQGLVYSWKQLLTFNSTIDIPQGEGSPPHGLIYWRFNSSETAYLSSKQNTVGYDLKAFNTLEYGTMLFSILLLTFVFWSGQQRNLLTLTVWATLFIIVSAIVCSNLSTVNARYVNRVIWLIPFISFTVLANIISKQYSLLRSSQNS